MSLSAPREQHDELVAAVTRDDVGRARQPDQCLRDELDGAAAGFVAVSVVDVLQVLDVDHQDRVGAIGAARRLVLLFGEPRERAHVVERRELVAIRQRANAALSLLMFSTSNVVENATSTNGASTPTAAIANSRVQALQALGQHADERIADAHEHDDERGGALTERQRRRDDRQQI